MAVFGLVSAVAGFVKVRYLVDKAIIDNMVFRCHYRITSAIFFVCCILCTANNLIGDPINCINDGAIPGHVINTFCWITSTFTLPHQQGKPVGTHVVHPGVGTIGDHEKETRYHAYYQWVPFMLFFQGVLFYIPHWIWKNWEEGKIRMISEGIRGAMISSKDERKDKQTRLVQYIIDTMHLHNMYAAGYFLCEALNFVNVIGNIYFIDLFLGGAFMTYGTDVVRFSNMDQENRTDPMVAIFPRLTKCTFYKFGASGTIQHHDSLCVMAMNILNEKIYIFLWFWLIVLALVSGLGLLYSVAITIFPSFRKSVLRRRFHFKPKGGIAALVDNMQVGDFLLIHLLGQNISSYTFKEILDELTQSLNNYNKIPTRTPSRNFMEMASMYPVLPKDADI